MKISGIRTIGVVHILAFLGIALGITNIGCEPQSEDPILFTSDGKGAERGKEIYSYSLKDGSEYNLSQSSGLSEYGPSISPDGNRVAFISSGAERHLLEFMLLNGSERQKLHVFESGQNIGQIMYTWSPDSKRIAFVDQTGSLFVVNVQSSETDLATEPAQITDLYTHDVGGWSKDGNWVVFSVADEGFEGIYKRNPDGVNEFRLTETQDTKPLWSPDSKRIAFLSTRDGNEEIYIMREDGSDQRRLTSNEATESHLAWSPDGKYLLFVSNRDGNTEIYLVEISGGKQIRLTHNAGNDYSPVWSPDGNSIVFVSEFDGDAELVIMDRSGDNQRQITKNEHADFDPDW